MTHKTATVTVLLEAGSDRHALLIDSGQDCFVVVKNISRAFSCLQAVRLPVRMRNFRYSAAW